MSINRYDVITAPSELAALGWESENDYGVVFYLPSYLTAFYSSLSVMPRLLARRNTTGRVVSLLPAFRVTPKTYNFFTPGKLLCSLLQRCGEHQLASEIDSASSRPAFVAAIPFGYTSPFRALPLDEIDEALDAFEQAAAVEDIRECACLYYSDRDTYVDSSLRRRGYLVAKLEANAILNIDRSWSTSEDYFRQAGKRRMKEYEVFLSKGYRCKWHQTIDASLIQKAVDLEANLLRQKKVPFSDDELCDWYESVKACLPENHLLLEVCDSAGSAVGTALFFRDGKTLIGKAIGLASEREDFLYFNIAYYEPVRFAIEHGYTAINYGPSAGEAKRLRGANPDALWGAFKLAPDHPGRSRWSKIMCAFNRNYDQIWGKADRFARS